MSAGLRREGALVRLVASADGAYVHGMGVVLLVCGVAALLAAGGPGVVAVPEDARQ